MRAALALLALAMLGGAQAQTLGDPTVEVRLAPWSRSDGTYTIQVEVVYAWPPGTVALQPTSVDLEATVEPGGWQASVTPGTLLLPVQGPGGGSSRDNATVQAARDPTPPPTERGGALALVVTATARPNGNLPSAQGTNATLLGGGGLYDTGSGLPQGPVGEGGGGWALDRSVTLPGVLLAVALALAGGLALAHRRRRR